MSRTATCRVATRPLAWLLAARGVGDNRQLETLAALVDADVRWIDCDVSVAAVLGGRVRCAIGQVPEPPVLPEPDWPDLVLLIGGLRVAEALAIRRASGGRSRIVCLGRPWAPLDWFDLVLTTPQYGLPEGPGVLQLPLPLNLSVIADTELEGWRTRLGALPRPLLGVLLGGQSGSYRFAPRSAAHLAAEVGAEIERAGGSAVVVTSPRTPAPAVRALREASTARVRIFEWQAGDENPYAAILRLADALLVTGDSASMLAEACDTDRPVAVWPLAERPRARVLRGLRRATPWLNGLRAAATRRGWWVPVRDLEQLHAGLVNCGRLSELNGLLDRGPIAAGFGEAVRATAARRVAALLDGGKAPR